MLAPLRSLTALALAALLAAAPTAGQESPSGLVCFGAMHEVIGQGRSEGRVSLDALAARPGFYGVGALAGLQGEITIIDSVVYTSGVGSAGALEALDPSGRQATLLLGQSVAAWRDTVLADAVPQEGVDGAVGRAAAALGVEGGAPFVFQAAGSFRDVRVHVINGACPVHARNRGVEIPAGQRPDERDLPLVEGTLVGVHATGAAGRLTHPGTSIHAHLVYRDAATGAMVTGHVERLAIGGGVTLSVPVTGEK